MILTRLEAENFLSFDSIDISLERGVNVIVGPNGVGKTNVLRIASTAFTLLLAAGVAEPDRRPMLAAAAWERLVPRIGSGRTDGWLAASICLDDEQLDRLATFIRAVAEVKAYEGVSRRQNETLPSDWVDLIADTFPVGAVEPLRSGRIVVTFNRAANPQFDISYEFGSPFGDGQGYHCVLGGQAMPGTLRTGPARPSSTVASSLVDPPIVGLDLSTCEGRSRLGFPSLLPQSGSTSWTIHGTNAQQHPLTDACLEAFRPEFLSAGFMWALPFGSILADVVRPRLRLTEGSRQPPLFSYEPWPGYAPLDGDASATMPLQLYRLMVGTAPERREFERICTAFGKLTGLHLAVRAHEETRPAGSKEQLLPSTDMTGRAQLTWQRVQDPPVGVLRCEPRILIGESDVRIDMAGAGAVEVLTNVTLATPGPGGIALLDEPATNMFPTRQRDFLSYLTGMPAAQFLMVTHSNYLVPVGSEDDLHRVTRLNGGPGIPTNAARFAASPPTKPNPRTFRSSQAFARLVNGDDVRASLFATAVIAVEGESEQFLLSAFLNNPTITGEDGTLDSLGYLVLDVRGQTRFGPYLDVFLGFGMPFVIFADGPALRSGSRLDNDLQQRGIVIPTSRSNESFTSRRSSCHNAGVFTIASSFGPPPGRAVGCKECKRVHGEAKLGEVESWIHKHFRGAFHRAHASWSGTGPHPKATIIRQVFDAQPPRPGSLAAGEMMKLYRDIQLAITQGGVHA